MLLNSRDFWTLPHLGCPALTQAFIQCTLPWLAPVGCPAALERRRSRPPAPLPNPAGLQACACHQPHGTCTSLVLNEWNSPRLQTSREWQEGCGCRATLSLLYDADASQSCMQGGGKAKTGSNMHGQGRSPFCYTTWKLCRLTFF